MTAPASAADVLRVTPVAYVANAIMARLLPTPGRPLLSWRAYVWFNGPCSSNANGGTRRTGVLHINGKEIREVLFYSFEEDRWILEQPRHNVRKLT